MTVNPEFQDACFEITANMNTLRPYSNALFVVYEEATYTTLTMKKDMLIARHLGLTLNFKGIWKDHINDINTKACSRLNVLFKYYRNRESLIKLYLVFIRPILEYRNIIWDEIL